MNDTKNTTNAAETHTRFFLRFLAREVSSILFIIYRHPRDMARNITARPSSTFLTSATASSPCQALPHTLITGARLSATADLLTEKSDPVKNVPTAVPTRRGARQPFAVRKALNVFFPRRLPALVWNSYDTAWKTNVTSISIHTQKAPPKLVL